MEIVLLVYSSLVATISAIMFYFFFYYLLYSIKKDVNIAAASRKLLVFLILGLFSSFVAIQFLIEFFKGLR